VPPWQSIGDDEVEQSRDLLSKWNRFVERARNEGVLFALLHHLKRVGIVAQPFYYMREALPAEIPEHLTKLPEGFEFSVFGRDDVMAISRLEERKGYVGEKYVVKNLNKGDACLGVKCHGNIAAFTWYSLVGSDEEVYPVTMKENEAYLYDMYVLKAYRGNNIAPTLRYRNYEVLRRIGRDTFYSVTEHSNLASLRFKQKLGAQPVLLAIHIAFFKKYRVRWVLRRYCT
jgi:ribosomal protein S18 acetylase RimI-like enzyme